MGKLKRVSRLDERGSLGSDTHNPSRSREGERQINVLTINNNVLAIS